MTRREAAESAPRPGRVITFYSYKGGTGRSMALANTGVLLAQRSNAEYETLMLDWDLEAPGLHKYFARREGGGAMIDSERPGLIDLFAQLAHGLQPFADLDDAGRKAKVLELVEELEVSNYITPTDTPHLHLMKAGRLDRNYAGLVNQFRWDEFYQRAPWSIRALAEKLARRYQFVLVDSRTGLTDTSGICTTLIPETLVVVFTPNAQSLEGVPELIERSMSYRASSDDLRPFVIYPLPSRIENTEPGERDAWRHGQEARGLPGWQRVFEDTIARVYGIDRCNLAPYFDEVQIQHQPYYAYGEKIAVQLERGTEIVSLPKSYERFVDWLVNRGSPWEDPALARAAAARRKSQELGRNAERAYAMLKEAEQETARRVFTRLVKILGEKEVGEYARQIGLVGDFPAGRADPAKVIDRFREAEILVVSPISSAASSAPPARASSPVQQMKDANTVQIADEALIHGWLRLREWLEKDREFLLWRQRLGQHLEAWALVSEDDELLLQRRTLQEAVAWTKTRASDLTGDELRFIRKSELAATAPPAPASAVLPSVARASPPAWTGERSTRMRSMLAGSAGLLLVVAAWTTWRFTRHTDAHAESVVAAASITNDPAEAALLLASLHDDDGDAALDRAREIAKSLVPLTILPTATSQGPVTSVAMSPSGAHVVTTSTDGSAMLWRIDSVGGAKALYRHKAAIQRASFSPDGALIALLLDGGDLVVLTDTVGTATSRGWNPARVSTQIRAESPVVAMSFDLDRRLHAVDRSGAFSSWQSSRCCGWRRMSVKRLGEVRSAVFSADGSRLATEFPGRGVSVWDNGAATRSTYSDSVEDGRLALSADGSYLASLSPNGATLVRGQLGSVIFTHRSPGATAVALDAYGSRIAVAGLTGATVVLRTTRAKVPARGDSLELRGAGPVRALSFGPDSSLVLTASDSSVRIWKLDATPPADTASWAQLRRFFATAVRSCLSVRQRMAVLGEAEPEANRAFTSCNQTYGYAPDSAGTGTPSAVLSSAREVGPSPPPDSLAARQPRSSGSSSRPRSVRGAGLTTNPVVSANDRITAALQGDQHWTGEWTREDGTRSALAITLSTKGSTVFGKLSWQPPPQSKGDSTYPSESRGTAGIRGSFDSTRLEFQLQASPDAGPGPVELRLLVSDESLNLRGTLLTTEKARGSVRATRARAAQ